MGIVKAKIPKVLKVLVRPSDVILAPAYSSTFVVAAQDGPEPAPDPPVQWFKGFPMAVLEVFKPSFAGFIDVGDYNRHIAAIAAFRLASDSVFEFIQALPARPASTVFKMIPQKVEALSGLPGVNQNGFIRMQGQSPLLDQIVDPEQGRFGFCPALAEDHEIIRIANHFVPSHFHVLVHLVQIDVGQKRADHRHLGASPFQVSTVAGPPESVV